MDSALAVAILLIGFKRAAGSANCEAARGLDRLMQAGSADESEPLLGGRLSGKEAAAAPLAPS